MNPIRRLARLSRRTKVLLAVPVLGFAGLNALAFAHAWSFTHYAEGGARTGRPEDLRTAEKVRALLLGPRIPRPRLDATPDAFGLAAETVRIPSSGAELEAWRIPGRRGRVVLFPGYASSRSTQLPAAAAFHALGFEALVVDFRGCGGSSGSTSSLGVLEAADVAAATPRGSIVFASSMGSAAVLRAIARHGVAPGAVILECPFGRLQETVEARFALMGIPPFPAARLLVFWGGVQHGFAGEAHDPVEYARSVRCPALLLHGERDPTVSVAQAREIHDAFAGPKRFHVFPGLGHALPPREGEWRRVVEEFLAASRL